MTQADFKRTWGIDAKKTLRYGGIKGVYWYYFSIAVRKRDFMEYGRCISCDKAVEDWRGCDAGHYIPAAGSRALLFDYRNVNLQCKPCNGPYANKKVATAGYAVGLDRRYGIGTATALYERRKELQKDWSDEIYMAKIKKEFGVEQNFDLARV